MALFIVALASIYFLGGSLFSAARMTLLFYPLMRLVFHVTDRNQLYYWLTVVRYAAHYMEYFVLFLVLTWLVRLRPLTALILCLILAVADEGHQYFLPDRTCSPRDIAWDSAGALTAYFLTIIAQATLAKLHHSGGTASEPAREAPA
jgi:VanZ family protein